MIESYKIGRIIIAFAFLLSAYLAIFAVLVIVFGKDTIIFYRGFGIGGAIILLVIFSSKIDWFSKEVFEINQK